MDKSKVLFLCTQNAARSQMAEGLLRALYGGQYEVFSAGSTPAVVNPYAIAVMAEAGIDISKHRSKSVTEFFGQHMDYVVTVCSKAQSSCPVFPGDVHRMHRSFDDPAARTGTDEEIRSSFRDIRDQLRQWIMETFDPENKMMERGGK